MYTPLRLFYYYRQSLWDYHCVLCRMYHIHELYYPLILTAFITTEKMTITNTNKVKVKVSGDMLYTYTCTYSCHNYTS